MSIKLLEAEILCIKRLRKKGVCLKDIAQRLSMPVKELRIFIKTKNN